MNWVGGFALAIYGVMLFGILSAYAVRKMRRCGLGMVLITACFLHSMATKPTPSSKFQHDDTLTLSNCWASNETSTVHIEWTKAVVTIPDETKVYIDYRQRANTNGAWSSLAESVMSARLWQGTLANCTNYDYYVYSDYVPPTPVHTNGVWNGYGGVTKDGKKYLTINGKISEHGKTIATPEKVRKGE